MEQVSSDNTAELRSEQVKSLYYQWKSLIFGCFFVVLSTSVILWGSADSAYLLLWAVSYFAFLAVRTRSLLKSPLLVGDAADYTPVDTRSITIYRSYSFVNGLFWGVVPFLLFTDDVFVFFTVMVIHSGYMATAVSATASYDLKSFYAFVFPASFLWAAGVLVSGGNTYLPHAVMAVFYPLFLSAFARRIYAAFETQVQLRLRNTELNMKLTDQRDRAERAMQEKNRFLASASHDLRQPVHALGLFVASLEPYMEKREQRKLLDQIKRTNESLGSLFHGLLDLSKLDANVVEFNPVHFSLQPMVSLLCEEFREQVDRKGLDLIRQCPEDIVCFTDPALLERILRNLISNAINYTDEGHVIVRAGNSDSGKVLIECVDSGRGIPSAEQENIFSEYHQLENPERDRKKGLGLGLAIVRRLAELMGVHILLQSEPNYGSKFSVVVPPGLKEAEPASLLAHIKPENQFSMTVLVIDDEEEILVGMNLLLSAWGCRVITAVSGDEVMAILQPDGLPDLILADFRLRDHESGLDLITRIREEFNSEIPAYLVTGDTAAERLQQAANENVEILHKPVEPKILKTLLSQNRKNAHMVY